MYEHHNERSATTANTRIQITQQLLRQAVEEARTNFMSVSRMTPDVWESFVFTNVIVLIGPNGLVMGKAVRMTSQTWYCAIRSSERSNGEWWIAYDAKGFGKWERYAERVEHTRIYGRYNLATKQYEEL